MKYLIQIANTESNINKIARAYFQLIFASVKNKMSKSVYKPIHIEYYRENTKNKMNKIMNI